jgi:hypothetical protein
LGDHSHVGNQYLMWFIRGIFWKSKTGCGKDLAISTSETEKRNHTLSRAARYIYMHFKTCLILKNHLLMCFKNAFLMHDKTKIVYMYLVIKYKFVQNHTVCLKNTIWFSIYISKFWEEVFIYFCQYLIVMDTFHEPLLGNP